MRWAASELIVRFLLYLYPHGLCLRCLALLMFVATVGSKSATDPILNKSKKITSDSTCTILALVICVLTTVIVLCVAHSCMYDSLKLNTVWAYLRCDSSEKSLKMQKNTDKNMETEEEKTEEIGKSYFLAVDEIEDERRWRDNEDTHEMFELEDDDEIFACMGTEIYGVYKPVHRRVKPVPGVFPEDARVIRQFPEDPLATLPYLTPQPPEFEPSERLTRDRLTEMNINPDGFLLPEEEKLFAHILKLNDHTLAFEESHRGTFHEDYFSPYIIPIVEHEPWEFKNIPIPPEIKEKVIALLKEKISAGVYEPSQSSYRSRWFCVMKKNGKLRIVHDLQPLNRVTIRDAGLPPRLDDFVEPFAGCKCYTVMDMYWGFDARKVHPTSRDLTAFQTPLGLLRITSLPMGFTNSPAEFQTCMAFLLQDEIPHTAYIFIDDLPIKGPQTDYPDENGVPEMLKTNPGIRRFIWEHVNDVHRIMHRVGHAGGTFSPNKAQMGREDVIIVGQKCTPEGRLPEPNKVEKILNWPRLKTIRDVRAFMGLCGTVRIWIKDYSKIGRALHELTRHGVEFVWEERQQSAFDTLKQAVVSAPALRPINYQSPLPVVLSVDSSKYAVGFILAQYDEDDRKRPARYGSLPMDECASRYSQPKLELYGLYRALRAYRLYLIGVQTLHVEVDAKYIKGMLNEPDLQPNATINRWIQGVLLFDFILIHIPAERHKGPDALSRRELAEDEEVEEEDDSWLNDIALYAETWARTPCVLAAFVGRVTTPRVYAETESKQDRDLHDYLHFLQTLQIPASAVSNQQRHRFIRRASRFFVRNGKMYRRNGEKPPLQVIFDDEDRFRILHQAHEGLGHRGEQVVMQTVKERFFWPGMWNDIRCHVPACHQCQICGVKKFQVPIIISAPSTIHHR